MKYAHRVTALSFIVLGLYVIERAVKLGLYSHLGPGAGFFPFFLGVIFAGLSMVWLLFELRRREPDTRPFLPSGSSAFRTLAILAAIVFCILFMDRLGFSLTMFVMLAFLLTVLGNYKPVLTIVLSLLGSVGSFYLFQHWLRVALPSSEVGFLKAFGF